MKNILRKTLATGMSLAMSMTMIPAVYAEETYNQNTTKDETVYISTDENGNTKSITVSDELKNIKGLNSISDISNLTDIVNVKGDESYSQDGNKLTWQGDDQNIVYQGKSDKKLPVDYQVTYYLDGKQVSEKDLKGSSGHVKVQFTFENHTKDNFVPFLMLAGMYIQADQLEQLHVDHGKTISDGDKQAAVVYGLPGIADALDIKDEDIQIPTEATVEFDVENYQSSQIAVIATNQVFTEDLPASMDEITGLGDKLNTLESATNQLVDGGHALKDGLNQLNEKTPELSSGISQLVDGSNQLSSGVSQLQSGLQSAYNSASSSLAPGSQQLSSGLNQMNTTLSTNLPTMIQSINQLNQGVTQTTNAINQLATGLSSNQANIQAMNQGIQTIATTMQAMDTQAQTLKQLSTSLQQISSMLSSGTITGSGQVTGTVDVAAMNQTEIAQLQAVLTTLNPTSSEYASIQSVITSLQAKANETVTVTGTATISQTASPNEQLNTLIANLNTLADGLQQEVTALNTALNNNGAQSLAPAFATFTTQMDSTIQSVNALNTQINPTLPGGMNQLAQGLNTFAQQSQTGLNQLSTGAQQLSTGISSQLLPGLSQLANGGDTLLNGTNQLTTGLSKLGNQVPTLVSGIKALNDGSIQLSDGLNTYQQQAIQPLVDKLQNELVPMIEKIKDMMSDAKSYTNYSGINENMNGSVKFIFIKNTEE